jgi:hypothetical protein
MHILLKEGVLPYRDSFARTGAITFPKLAFIEDSMESDLEDRNLSLSGTIIRGTLKTPNSQLVTPISIKLQRPDGYD